MTTENTSRVRINLGDHTPKTTTEPTAYHYILAVQLANGALDTWHGVIPAGPNATRSEALAYLLNRHYPGQNAAVINFSLEPNHL